MSACSNLDFEVRWLPYQLNPKAREEPSSKIEAYMKKFQISDKRRVMEMSAWMGNNFKQVGLPYKFTEAGLVSNTFNAHRVLTVAYQEGGAAAQDKAAESLFHSYFAEERAPNDPEALKKAAEAAGLNGQALLDDVQRGAALTHEELEIGRRLRVTGVPHFVIRAEGSGSEKQIAGAEPPASFVQAFKRVAGN